MAADDERDDVWVWSADACYGALEEERAIPLRSVGSVEGDE